MASQVPPISPDGAYWWDGQAWQPMPEPLPQAAPPISPDGAYWWDGHAWQPMPGSATEMQPAPLPRAADLTPSWLPAGTEMPGTLVSPTAHAAAPPPEPVHAFARPAWQAPPPAPSPNRTLVTYAALGVIVVMALGAGAWTVHQMQQNPSASTSSRPAAAAASANPSPAATVAPSPTPAALPLTADITGDYCPISHYGDPACWKGSFTNTGPAIGKLAFIFIGAGPYTNWYSTHSNEVISGFYSSGGCDTDRANSEIVCGSVDPGGQVSVYIIGDATTRGTFEYGVKFADISSGSPVYIDANPDGTHLVLSWVESIS